MVGGEGARCSPLRCSPRGNISLRNTGMIYVDPSAWPFAVPHVRMGGWRKEGGVVFFLGGSTEM